MNLRKAKKTIAIIGLGYVGLPLLNKFIQSKKYEVIGIDNNNQRIDSLKKGKSYISHISNLEIKFIKEKSKNLTSSYKVLKECHYIIFTLPTPLTKNKDPDMNYISSALESSKKYFKKNQLIILESTVYPGATEEYFVPVFEEQGFKVGKNIFLGYSPEREDPGNQNYNISNITKIVSGFSKICTKKSEEIYNSINIKTKKVSSIKTAEITKLYENIFRSVNIGLVNEMKLISDKMKLDIHEIIDAAKTKPFGFKAFYPGPGLGGHCIPIDPYLLTWKAKQYDQNTKFIELSADINNSMPNFVIQKINDGLNQIKKNFSNSKILIIGVAYKKNVNDIRESPAIKIIKELVNRGSEVYYHDNFIKNLNIKSKKKIIKINSVKIEKTNLLNSDLVCVVTDHDYINYNLIKKFSRIIVDCRGKYKNKRNILKA